MNESKVMQMLHRQMEKNYETLKDLSPEERVKKITSDAESVKSKIALKKSEKKIA